MKKIISVAIVSAGLVLSGFAFANGVSRPANGGNESNYQNNSAKACQNYGNKGRSGNKNKHCRNYETVPF